MIVAEFADGPAAEERVERLAAYWAPEPFAIVLVRHNKDEGSDKVAAVIWYDIDPDDRSWSYTADDGLTAHVYRLADTRRQDGSQLADYKHDRVIR